MSKRKSGSAGKSVKSSAEAAAFGAYRYPPVDPSSPGYRPLGSSLSPEEHLSKLMAGVEKGEKGQVVVPLEGYIAVPEMVMKDGVPVDGWSVYMTCYDNDVVNRQCPDVLYCQCRRCDFTNATLKARVAVGLSEVEALARADALNHPLLFNRDGSPRVIPEEPVAAMSEKDRRIFDSIDPNDVPY